MTLSCWRWYFWFYEGTSGFTETAMLSLQEHWEFPTSQVSTWQSCNSHWGNQLNKATGAPFIMLRVLTSSSACTWAFSFHIFCTLGFLLSFVERSALSVHNYSHCIYLSKHLANSASSTQTNGNLQKRVGSISFPHPLLLLLLLQRNVEYLYF